jgi:hypothetical protein
MGSSVAPKQFGMPGIYGQSQGGNIVQQSQQAAPLTGGQNLIPLQQPTQPVAQQPQAQPVQNQAVDPNADLYSQDPIAQRFGRSFYGDSYY